MTYCGHYWARGGAWPCTVLTEEGEEAEGGLMPDRQVEGMSTILRAITLCESALRAYEQGATRDQLGEYIEEIRTTLMRFGGGELDAGTENDPASPEDPETSPPVP